MCGTDPLLGTPRSSSALAVTDANEAVGAPGNAEVLLGPRGHRCQRGRWRSWECRGSPRIDTGTARPYCHTSKYVNVWDPLRASTRVTVQAWRVKARFSGGWFSGSEEIPALTGNFIDQSSGSPFPQAKQVHIKYNRCLLESLAQILPLFRRSFGSQHRQIHIGLSARAPQSSRTKHLCPTNERSIL